MRVIVTVALVALLVANLLPAQQPADVRVKQDIAALPQNSLVEVRMTGGDRLRGRIVGRGPSDFSLEREKEHATQTIPYDRVLSVSQIRAGHSHKKWIIIGVAVAAIAVIAIVIAVKASHPLQGAHIGI